MKKNKFLYASLLLVLFTPIVSFAALGGIKSLLEALKELINLKRLILHHNKFTKYPKITLEMPSLDELDLGESKYNGSQNKITELPKKMNSNLKSLDLSDNLIFDISPLKDLKELLENPEQIESI